MKVRFPAKIILFGEHSIVYKDSIAVISAVDLFTTADYGRSKDYKYNVKFTSKSFKIATTFTAETATTIYQQCQQLHQEYLNTGDITKLKDLIKGKGNFFKLIIGYLIYIYPQIIPIAIRIHTQAPLGSGMGTSASIAAAVIKSVLELNDIKHTKSELLKFTKDIEDMQHGRSSGADPAAVIYAGLIKFTHNTDGSRAIDPIQKNNSWSKDLYLILSGDPQESTGEMVSKVSKYRRENKQDFENIFKQINQIVNTFLKSRHLDMPALINTNGLLLEQLGIVSTACIKFSNEIRKNGGAIKIAGAGGTAKGSGVCLVYFKDLSMLKRLLDKYNFSLIPAHFIT